MSIDKRINRLENKLQPTTTSPSEIKDLEALAYDMQYDSENWPDLQKEDDVFTNLKRIVPAPGDPIEKR